MTFSSEKNLEGFGDQPGLFLDRDGVIVADVPYNTDPSKVILKPGIETLIGEAHTSGMWVVVVSNQSGLGRGLFSWTDYRRVHQRMCALLAEKGHWVDLALCAPYIEGTEYVQALQRPHFRKPNTGMFEHAREELGLSFSKSVMIGDRATDLVAAHKCGIEKLYLVSSSEVAIEIQNLTAFQKENPKLSYQKISTFSEVVF